MIFSEIAQALHQWCKVKLNLSKQESRIIFKERDVWWCSIGMNIGEEIFGKGPRFMRPVLIFRKFTHNSFLGLPLTLIERHGSWYVEIPLRQEKRWVLLHQARVLDKKRLSNRIATLDPEAYKNVKERFLALYQ